MDNTHLSKRIAYILRHAPWEYELELDDEGWAPIEQLLDGLRSHHEYAAISVPEIAEMIAASEKARFEIAGDRIRAYYGHSLPGKIRKQLAEPPEHLYHGTVPRFVDAIRVTGLRPMRRQYVHLSSGVEMAQLVARRRGSEILILPVRARAARAAGIPFYAEENGVWLADGIAAEWIDFP